MDKYLFFFPCPRPQRKRELKQQQTTNNKMASSPNLSGSSIDGLIKTAMANGFKWADFIQSEWLKSCKIGNTGPHKSGLSMPERRRLARYFLEAFVHPADGCQLCGAGSLVTENCNYAGCKGKRSECSICWFAKCSYEEIHE